LRALDLFSGAGGAARGLQLAGFHVVGVDIIAQPRYAGDAFVQADALTFLASADLAAFDFVWSSPPCQRYTSLRHAPGLHRNADLVAATRAALKRTGLPYVIENVVGAPLIDPILLCGSMFGLGAGSYRIERHRLFEASFLIAAPTCQHDERPVLGLYGAHCRDRRRARGTNHRGGSNVASVLGYVAMGIPFGSMTMAEISDAIPPAYAFHVAGQWLKGRKTGQGKPLAAV
jgi:DNA (cytosine-5)-methyltransferase 1